MLFRYRVKGFAHSVFETAHGIIVPAVGLFVPKHNNVLAVLGTPEGKFLHPAANIVTDAGDIYYAQQAADETPTNAFGIHELATAGTPGKAADRSDFTPIAATQKAHTAGYPQTDDADADNTGAGTDVATYLASYGKADFADAAISHGMITNTGAAGADPLLTGYAFAAPFGKTVNDTLKVFVNHEFTGV